MNVRSTFKITTCYDDVSLSYWHSVLLRNTMCIVQIGQVRESNAVFRLVDESEIFANDE